MYIQILTVIDRPYIFLYIRAKNCTESQCLNCA